MVCQVGINLGLDITLHHCYDKCLIIQRIEEDVSEDQIHAMLQEADLCKNGQVDLAEFLQVSTSR